MTSSSHGVESTDAMNRLFEDLDTGASALHTLQAQYDRDMWDISHPQFANLRHIHMHLSITVGKIARMIEPRDHSMYHGEVPDLDEIAHDIEPILADLVMHAAQIANMNNGNLGDMIRRRYRSNSARFAPDSMFAHLPE